MNHFLLDIRYGLRVLRTAPGFTTVAILSLALGIGANTAIFSIINALLLKPLPVREPQRLVQIVAGQQHDLTTALWEQLRDRQQVLESVIAWGPTTFDLASGGERRPVGGRYVSGTFFRTLGVDAALGRLLMPADDVRGGGSGPDGPVAVLSDAFWRREYGAATDIIGRPIRLNGHPVTIVGVMPRGFFGTEVGEPFEVAVPLGLWPLSRGKDTQLASLTYWWLHIGGRLNPDQTVAQASAGLQAITQSVVEGALTPEVAAHRQRPYLDGPFTAESMETGTSIFRQRYRSALMMVMAIVGVVLLLACTNLASLMLARATARQHEFAVRLALGAGRARLVRQLLIESLMLAIAGAALGLAVARWASTLLLDQLSVRLWRITLDVNPDWRVLLFTGTIAVLTALLFGVAPAWRSTNVTASDVLRTTGRAQAGGWRGLSTEKLLIVAQIACSLVLVLGAALFVRSFAALTTLDPGFDARGVLLIDADTGQANYTPDQRRLRFAQVLDALRAIPGVQHASSSVVTPMGTMAWQQNVMPAPLTNRAATPGPTSSAPQEVHAFVNRVSADYPLTMRTSLLSGRPFNDRDTPESAVVALVNEAFVRAAWPGSNAIGQHFWMGRVPSPTQVEVVGVLKDSKYRSLREPAPPTVFLAAAQDREPFAKITYELRSSTEAGALVTAVKQTIERVDPKLALDFRPFAMQVRESTTRERMLALLSAFFGALALLVAGVGLYGMMSLAVTRRRNEIGVRMALGADHRRIARLMLRDVALVITLGLSAGTIAALLSGQLVTKFLFDLSPSDPTTYALAIALLAAVALIAGYLPARRAAHLDPMVALREE
jgi:putative ABC transport system permease protein